MTGTGMKSKLEVTAILAIAVLLAADSSRAQEWTLLFPLPPFLTNVTHVPRIGSPFAGAKTTQCRATNCTGLKAAISSMQRVASTPRSHFGAVDFAEVISTYVSPAHISADHLFGKRLAPDASHIPPSVTIQFRSRGFLAGNYSADIYFSARFD